MCININNYIVKVKRRPICNDRDGRTLVFRITRSKFTVYNRINNISYFHMNVYSLVINTVEGLFCNGICQIDIQTYPI